MPTAGMTGTTYRMNESLLRGAYQPLKPGVGRRRSPPTSTAMASFCVIHPIGHFVSLECHQRWLIVRAAECRGNGEAKRTRTDLELRLGARVRMLGLWRRALKGDGHPCLCPSLSLVRRDRRISHYHQLAQLQFHIVITPFIHSPQVIFSCGGPLRASFEVLLLRCCVAVFLFSHSPSLYLSVPVKHRISDQDPRLG